MPSKKQRRAAVAPLPSGVFRVPKPTGKVYYYHQLGRHLPKALRGDITRIPHDPREPQFWSFCAALNGRQEAPPKPGTVRAVVEQYRASPHWDSHREKTRNVYDGYLDIVIDAWGKEAAADVPRAGVVALRDAKAQTSPSSANLMLKVINAMFGWAVENTLMPSNPAREVKPVKTDVETTQPWPEEVWQAVVDHAPADLSRLAFLGRATGQRISDLIRLRPANREQDGFAMKIGKLRDRPHFLALDAADAVIIDSWTTGEMAPYITKPDGTLHTPHSIRARLHTWVADSAPEHLRKADVTPHGLRALACCDARLAGREHQEIAGLYGMSPNMVLHYTRHIDQALLGRRARAGMERAKNDAENKSASALKTAKASG